MSYSMPVTLHTPSNQPTLNPPGPEGNGQVGVAHISPQNAPVGSIPVRSVPVLQTNTVQSQSGVKSSAARSLTNVFSVADSKQNIVSSPHCVQVVQEGTFPMQQVCGPAVNPQQPASGVAMQHATVGVQSVPMHQLQQVGGVPIQHMPQGSHVQQQSSVNVHQLHESGQVQHVHQMQQAVPSNVHTVTNSPPTHLAPITMSSVQTPSALNVQHMQHQVSLQHLQQMQQVAQQQQIQQVTCQPVTNIHKVSSVPSEQGNVASGCHVQSGQAIQNIQSVQQTSPGHSHQRPQGTVGNISQTHQSPAAPVELVSDTGEKFYKLVWKDGKVRLFRAALDESTSAADVSGYVNGNRTLETSVTGTTAQPAGKPTLKEMGSPSVYGDGYSYQHASEKFEDVSFDFDRKNFIVRMTMAEYQLYKTTFGTPAKEKLQYDYDNDGMLVTMGIKHYAEYSKSPANIPRKTQLSKPVKEKPKRCRKKYCDDTSHYHSGKSGSKMVKTSSANKDQQSEKHDKLQHGRGTSISPEVVKNKDESIGALTLAEYNSMACEEKSKLDNRVRQWAHRARQHLPHQHFIFCLVLAHLLRNAHTYFNLTNPTDLQLSLLEGTCVSRETRQQVIEEFKQANRKVHEVNDMKKKNRKEEQMQMVEELRDDYGSISNIAYISGISRKSVQKWCSEQTVAVKKRVELSQLRRQEYEQFLLQDTISFEHPCKKYAGRRYLRNTIKEIRKLYVQQPEFHKYGILSESRMKEFRPDYIYLCARTPMESCLCQGCENCEKILKALLAIGMKLILCNRFEGVNAIVCSDRIEQYGTHSKFAKLDCLQGNCTHCGVKQLVEEILRENKDLILLKKTVTWKKWTNVKGRKVPDIVHTKGSIVQALNYMVSMLKIMATHLFRSTWNRNLFDYSRRNMFVGLLAQIFDFSMNFRNTHQDEIQSAFFEATQTSIHTVINYFLCLNRGCSEIL